MKWLRAVALTIVAAVLGGCYAYVPPPPRAYVRPVGCFWVPAHRTYYGWAPGHWRC